MILCDGELFSYANIHTGAVVANAVKRAFDMAVGDTGITAKDLKYVGATGWGKAHVDFATACFSEVQSHAKGGRFLFGPSVHTVVDLGVRQRYRLNILAVRHDGDVDPMPGPSYRFRPDDRIVLLGSDKDVQKFLRF